ncbi:MAG TPA: hypothetical protein VFC46_03690 [Humisphaera sp.]|nr:hypothetical protein [Humisphaera sp.]
MPHVNTPQTHCRLGAARGDITPPVGIYHRMWGAASHDRSTGIHRLLTATVLAIRSDGATTASSDGGMVVVSLDHCILGESDIDNIRRHVAESTSFQFSQVHVSLTHTHGAGLMMRDRADLPGGDLIVPYLEEVARRVGSLAREAEQSLRPASIVYGVGRCNLAAHRDFFDTRRGGYVCGFNPNQRADDTVMVGRATDSQRRTIATIVNYACHPTTLAWENTLISPDYLGAMRETTESMTGGAPCLFLQGASAELGPREGFVGDVQIADRNGRQLAYAALSVLESLPPPATRFEYTGAVISGAVLGTWRHIPVEARETAALSQSRCRKWVVDLPYRADRPTLVETRTERERLIALEQLARQNGDVAADQDLRAKVEQMTRQIMRLEALPPGDAFPLPVAVYQLGAAVWVFVAGEHYSVLQTTLRNRFPNLAILVATITDGWQPGYLPQASVYGKGIYQESIAMVAPGSLERVIEEIVGQIEKWNGDLPK